MRHYNQHYDFCLTKLISGLSKQWILVYGTWHYLREVLTQTKWLLVGILSKHSHPRGKKFSSISILKGKSQSAEIICLLLLLFLLINQNSAKGNVNAYKDKFSTGGMAEHLF